eukprot:2282236-Prymnesium_polylepis.1
MLSMRCAAQAVPTLRRLRGVRAAAEAASEALGSHRRHRCLHELVVSSTSPLAGLPLSKAGSHPLLRHVAIWSVRRWTRSVISSSFNGAERALLPGTQSQPNLSSPRAAEQSLP